MNQMKIYTKQGDFGDTRLCNGQIVSKDSDRVEAYGDVDELNSMLGLYVTKTSHEDLKEIVKQIQSQLFIMGSMLATPTDVVQSQLSKSQKEGLPYIKEEYITWLEKCIDGFEEELKPLTHFIVPGGCEESALLHVSRTVCRRAERRVVALKHREELNKELIKYINRLSDLLFVMSRVENKRSGNGDELWRRPND
jgi:cob(I)alamin adenosyltransferase